MNAVKQTLILLVDDNDQNSYLLQVLLEGHGFVVETAHNGEDALKKARKKKPDLVVSDILMPVMDGFVLCREWHANADLSVIPFIFYTATYTDIKDERFAMILGAVRFIVKPQEPDTFIKIIDNVLAEYEAGELPESSIQDEPEPVIMREYSEILVHKLEEKMVQLEETHVLLEEKIEELERTSHALRESDSRFRDFASIAADWFFETDSNFHITYISQKYGEITGLNPDSLIEQHVLNLFNATEDNLLTDHLLKNLQANLAIHDFEYSLRLDDNRELLFRYNGMPHEDEDGVFCGYRFVAHDITESNSLSNQLTYQATHDALTGLINRWEFDRRLKHLLSGTEKNDQVLCYLDIDRFKIVNDTCGHIAGDNLLKQLSEVLRNNVRESDTLARIGGDEFAVIMEHCPLTHAQRVAENIRLAIENFQFRYEDHSFNVSASIGLVEIGMFTNRFSEALSAADGASYAAKEKGGNRVHVYRLDDREILRWKQDMRWTSIINNALNDGRFVLYAQEIIPVSEQSEEIKRYEILIRMIDEQGELVLPDEFLPSAEKYSLMPKIDRWVLETAFDWILQQKQAHAQIPMLSINLSGSTLGDEDLLQFLVKRFADDIDPSMICFEITETLAVSSFLLANGFIGQLRDIGCHFSIDDFGSGVCSYAYLKQLDFDYIKIDGFFVRSVPDNPIDQAVVRSINDIGHLMGKKTVAEYVENSSIREELASIGVDFAQGFGIHSPVPLSDIVLQTMADKTEKIG